MCAALEVEETNNKAFDGVYDYNEEDEEIRATPTKTRHGTLVERKWTKALCRKNVEHLKTYKKCYLKAISKELFATKLRCASQKGEWT